MAGSRTASRATPTASRAIGRTSASFPTIWPTGGWAISTTSTIENPLDSIDTVNFGFRFDMLFGNDWQFTKDYGLFDHAFPNNHFAGLDLPQIYARGPPADPDAHGDWTSAPAGSTR